MSDRPETDSPQGSALSRDVIVSALRALSDELGKQEIKGEVCLFGGTVMVLAFNARLTTKDVDAMFQPAQLIRQLAQSIANDHRLPSNWLNDGVKGFVSGRHNITEANLPQFANLRLTMPVPEYMLAMKCMAARLGGTESHQSDVPDIIFLIRHLHLTSAQEVLDIVTDYYPPNRIRVKTQYLIEGLFEEGKI